MANKTNYIQATIIPDLFHTQQGKWNCRNEAKSQKMNPYYFRCT